MTQNISIDVMYDYGRRHHKTLRYPFNPIFKTDVAEVFRWLYERVPSCRGRKDVRIWLKYPDGEEIEFEPVPE